MFWESVEVVESGKKLFEFATTVRETCSVFDAEIVSVTCTVKVVVPTAFGVPLMIPVEPFRLAQPGIVQVAGQEYV